VVELRTYLTEHDEDDKLRCRFLSSTNRAAATWWTRRHGRPLTSTTSRAHVLMPRASTKSRSRTRHHSDP